MDLYQLLAGADAWHTRRMLERAATLTQEQLDRPIAKGPQLTPWEPPERNLRELLSRLVVTKEAWAAALSGGSWSENKDDSPRSLLARFDAADAQFNQQLESVRVRNAWEDTFVDAICEPPETFTFGGMFGHVLTFNTYRRLAALEALRTLGITDLGMGCPMEYEAALAPARS